MIRFLSTLAAVLACLVLPVAAVSTWVDLRVTNTSGYLDAVAPLSDNPDIEQAAAQSIASAVLDGTHLGDSDGATSAVDSASEKVVASDTFASVWKSGNRAAHGQIIDILADDSASLVDDNGNVDVDLGDLLDPIAEDVSGGLLSAGGLDDVGLSVDIVDADTLVKARRTYRVAHDLGLYPAIAWVLLVLLALALPGARRRALSVLGVGTLLATALTAGALLVGRSFVVDKRSPIATAIFDALAHSLWVALVVLAVAAVVALLTRAVLGRTRA